MILLFYQSAKFCAILGNMEHTPPIPSPRQAKMHRVLAVIHLKMKLYMLPKIFSWDFLIFLKG